MSLTLVLLFMASIGCDVAGQVLFKLGAMALPDAGPSDWRGFLSGLPGNRWLMAGIGVYVIELVIWLRILSEVPVSIAFPVASLNFLGVAVASRVLLGETLGARQWAGAGLVTIGVALVAGTA